MLNITVLVSGGGTNLQALIDATERGSINGRIVRVIAGKSDAYALKRAAQHGIPSCIIKQKEYPNQQAFDHALITELKKANTDLVVLAGYLSILGKEVTSAFSGRMINIHPSLIPSFCGAGYYGLHVHEAALKYGVKVTGATVHFVNEIPDGGAIILQKAVDVLQDDTPESLQKRVMEQAEWVILPQAVSLFCDGLLSLTKDGKVIINERGKQ